MAELLDGGQNGAKNGGFDIKAKVLRSQMLCKMSPSRFSGPRMSNRAKLMRSEKPKMTEIQMTDKMAPDTILVVIGRYLGFPRTYVILILDLNLMSKPPF